MAKSIISVSKKRKPGRPKVGSTLVGVRLPPAELGVIDEWRRQQDNRPGRPEAIRRLVEIGLKAKGK